MNSQKDNTQDVTNPEKVEELDANILAALGTTPVTQKPIEIELDSRVAESLLHTRNFGADKKELAELKAKYHIPDKFQPPDLLSGIETNAAARHLRKEQWRLRVQEDLCPALAMNVAIITMIMAEKRKNKTPELEKIESMLCESSRLVANAIWQETESRLSFIAPAFIPSVRQIVKKSSADNKLVGDNIVEKAKQHMELRSIMQHDRFTRPTRGGYGNFRSRPYNTRPAYPMWQQQQLNYSPQMLSTNVPQSFRPKSYYRGRGKSNQPTNPRIFNKAGALMIPKQMK